jgi:GTPase
VTSDVPSRKSHLSETMDTPEALSGIDASALAQKLLMNPQDTPSAQPGSQSLKSILLTSGKPLEELIYYKLSEGLGEFLLEIGIEEDGSSMQLSDEEFQSCIANVESQASKLGADVSVAHQRRESVLQTSSSSDQLDKEPEQPTKMKEPHKYGHLLIRKGPGEVQDLLELRICVVGNVDAGKSTLLGVLTKNQLDDGRGKVRVNLFRHKHEVETGRTSSVGLEVMGFDSKGEVVTPSSVGKQKLQWEDICVHASKVITFLDLAGYLITDLGMKST